MSEGRDLASVSQMEIAIREAGSLLLDTHSDADHHRTVFTLVGDADIVVESALRLAFVALERIDLRAHDGVHPRFGAIDVVPFIPLSDATMGDCVALARRAGERIAGELGLPVYLYGDAATTPGRRNLAAIRKDVLQDLAIAGFMLQCPPDFGPAKPHPTGGAVAVGARPFLVAFNVVLATSDSKIAQRIAAEVRESGGGLPGVRALGLPLASRRLAQVSMNLTDVGGTGVAGAYRAVAEAAGQRGIEVLESEIVGLAPRRALEGATTEGLRLTRALGEVVLEDRLLGR